MRGEVKDSFGLDAALADRLKAGDALMKRFIAIQSKTAENECEDLTPLAEMLTEHRP